MPRFASVARKYDAAQGILGDLRRALNIEETLEHLIRERDAKPHRIGPVSSLARRIFIREVIGGAQANWLEGFPDHVTNYVHLVEQGERWRAESKEQVAFVTFNYDTLLEDELVTVSRRTR